MDDDYDNYVPQISTLDWQNLGGDTRQDGSGSGGAQGGGPTGAFLFEGMGQSAESGGQFQQQRPFPGMGMTGSSADYGAGGIQGSYQAAGGGFLPTGMQSQMAAQQQQMQRQMMGMPLQQTIVGQYGPIGPQSAYSAGQMLPPPPPTANGGGKSTGGSTKGSGKGSKKSKKAQQAAEAAAAAAQQATAVEQQQQQASQMIGTASGSGQPQQFPMAGGQMGGFYYKSGPGPPTQQPQMMMPSGAAGAQSGNQQMAGKWPPQYQQQSQADEQRQQFGGQQQMQAAQQQQQHYGPIQHLQSQYGPQAQQHLQQQQPQSHQQQQSYSGYHPQTQQSAQKSGSQEQNQQSQQIQQQKQQQVVQQQAPGQYNMAQTAGYYGQQQPQQYPPQQTQQQQQTAGPAAGGPTGPSYQMGMPHQQQLQQAGPANYQQMGGYPPGYSSVIAMQQKQAYYAQQQMMAAGAPPNTPAGAYYQQQSPYAIPNPYLIQQQQQQIYREMYECDQQLGQAIAQAQSQQSPELAMRIEKLQMHRQYLQQAAHHAAAAVAAAANAGAPMGVPIPMGMVATGGSRDPNQQQTAIQSTPVQQYQPSYPTAGQQGPTGSVPVQQQQKLPPSQPQPSYGPPQYAAPPAPGGPGFHSPNSGPQSIPSSQHQQQQPTPQQQVAQPQQQQMGPAQYAPPPPAPHMSSPSVAVMSASNQVQVNIRPAEMPGRTMISVYHSPDIPSTSIQPAAVVSSAAMPYQMPPVAIQMGNGDQNGQNLSAKDSIPPEPLPPNLAQEQKRRKQQQQLEQEQQAQQKREQLEHQQQIREQQAKQMQIQQQHVQAVQSTMTSSHMQIQSPKEQQFSMDSSMVKQQLLPPSIKAKSPPCCSPKTPPTVNNSVTLNFFGPNQNAMAKCSKTFPIILTETVEFCVEEVKEKEVEKPVEIEPFEISASFMDHSEEQSIQQSVKDKKEELSESFPTMNQQENSELNEDEEQPSEINEMLDEEEQQRLQKHAMMMEKIGSEEGEGMMEDVVKDEEKESIIEDEKEEQREEIIKEKIQEVVEKSILPQIVESMNYLEAEETMTPSTSDAQLEGKADDKESTADDSQWPGTSTKETSPQDVEDFPFSFRSTKGSTSRKLSAPGGGTRSGKLRNKKRKMDWNRDEDDDYVGSKKKKGKRGGGGSRKEKAVEEEAEAMDLLNTQSELLDEEMLVEKRRSSRKSAAGKKAKYGEDSENDEALGEPLKPEKPSTDVAMLEPVEERIVEKILGVRMAKRLIRKEKMKEEPKEEGETMTKKIEEEEDGMKRSKVRLEEEEEKGEEEKIKEELADEITKKDREMLIVQKEEEKDGAKEGELATNDENDGKKLEEEEQKEEKEIEWEEEVIELEELYVKFKGFSYMHCEWKTVEELEEMGDKRVMAKLNRWKQKFGDAISGVGEEDEQEYFNEDYMVVARVLDETYDDKEKQHYIFVKWKALPYEDCTWELVQDIPEQKMAEFRQRVEFDTCKLKEQPRLSPAQWSSQLAIPKEKLYKNENVLREYQHEGVNWLLWTWANGQNCILADEMGLGKTVQTIVFFQSLYDIGIHGPFLVVVPLSTLGNWEREFDNWTDINAIVYHGSVHSRRIIQEYEFFYKKGISEAARRRNIPKFDALITTYEVVVQEVEVLKRINFRVGVIDEAHRIKNRNCKLLQTGLLSLKMEHRVLLTGTPLQNNIQELFSLLNFLEPEQFANSEAFLQQFGQCQTEEQVQKLQEILKPMMLRRLKEDVEKELQPKEETIIEVQLSNIQKKYYRAVLERNFTHLMKGTTPSLINTMMQLRKCCNHPYLINGAEEQILAELKISHSVMTEEQLQVFGLISSSGKLVLIDKLLPKLHADGHKVLIFSQMVRVLDLLEEYLNIKSYPFERIDGNIRGNERQAAIDRFSKPENKDRFVFLLCTRAGGLGINLTAADTVIIFDSDWNPQNDLQAQARCHRIGQTKPVKIYRLITSNTYEREMFDKASLKLGLDKAVLQSMLHRSGTGENIQQMSRQEVEDLLRKGAYGAIMDEDNEGTKFSEEDIDTILQRRTQTIRLEPGVKGSTFAKASFTTSHNRDDIDIGDPDFWSKWAKKANIDVDALNDEYSGKHLIVHEPRSRKKRFEAENFKRNSESGDEAGGTDDDERQSTPGASRIAEGVKSRSARKKRRTAAGGNGGGGGEEDDDYAYKPDELAFSKTVYFKVEKLLTQWGWGRWAQLKQWSELSEHDLEHIARTLLLHCIREFKGDEKVRDYVWALISPNAGKEADGKEEKVSKATSTDSKSKFNQGWAVLPEYNPPFICVDMTFQRHLHRHSNKLLNRVQHLHFLQSQLANNELEGDDQMHLRTELSDGLDGWLIMPQWDRECDRDLLLGVHKHGMENWETIRTDAGLCFAKKSINFPNTLDLNNRFKYLISVLLKRAETAGPTGTSTAQSTTANKMAATEVRWTKVEETDFMRILRNYGVKDDTNSENVINWVRFREISIVLRNKTDAEMLEMLYCVLAMCTKQQGGMLSPVDERRADRVEAIPAKSAEKLMNRLHLMRKVHAIITMGIQNIRGMLKMVALDVMSKGWSEAHDEHLLIVVDKFGLEDIHGKLKHLPKLFDAIQPLDEHLLLRRVVEICATLEQGKWSGAASIENLEETTAAAVGAGEHGTSEGGQHQQSTSVIVGKGAKGGGNGGNGRKKADSQKQKGNNSAGQGTMDKNASGSISTSGKIGNSSSTNLTGAKGGSGLSSTSTAATMSYNEQQILMKMMEQMSNPQYLLQLMSMMGSTGPTATSSSTANSSSNSNAALQQQFQQLQTLLTLTALSGPTDLSAASNLSTLTTASLASLAGMTGTSSSQGILPKATSTDVLNLSKKSAGSNEGNARSSSITGLSIPKSTSSSSLLNASTPTSTTTLAPTTPQQSATSTPMKSTAFSSADACLSTGLSTSAINKLSQMSVPELLAFSNLAPETRIPVVHTENQQKLEGEKAPTLKSLDQFLRTNSKYSVDLLSLATSHPSLFSATGAGPMMSMTPTTIGQSMTIPKTPTTPVTTKKSTQQQGTPNISGTTTPIATPTLKAADKLGTTTALPQSSSASSSITQQLIEQTKKGNTCKVSTMNSSSGTSSSAAAGHSSSISSLFGFDLQSGTSSSSSAAALNQFLAGLTPSTQQQSSSQIQQSSAAALAQGGGSTSSSTSTANNFKNMEQQLLLLQQAALLGSAVASSAAFNPYAALLYTNPTDLFGTKTSSSTSSLQSSFLGNQNATLNAAMSDSTMAAAAAALAQAAGFPSSAMSTASTDLTSALTSELYMAAMASTLPSLLGGNVGGQSSSTTSSQSAAAFQANSAVAAAASIYGSMANAATLEQLLTAAGLGANSMSATTNSSNVGAHMKGLTGAQTHNKSDPIKSNTSQTTASSSLPFQHCSAETSTSSTAQFGGKKSGGGMGGTAGGKGLKLNAVLEKLASVGAANSATTSSSFPFPLVAQQQTPTTTIEPKTEMKSEQMATGDVQKEEEERQELGKKNAQEEKIVEEEEVGRTAQTGDESKDGQEVEMEKEKKDKMEDEKGEEEPK